MPLAESIIAFLFIACIIANTFLFARGQDSYSIKYEIMRKHRFFRVHYCASLVVEVVYKIFFLTPCLFLLTVVVMEGIVKPLQVFPVSVNGMIVLLMLVPVKREYYFWKELALWVLAFASQIISLLLYENVETTR